MHKIISQKRIDGKQAELVNMILIVSENIQRQTGNDSLNIDRDAVWQSDRNLCVTVRDNLL